MKKPTKTTANPLNKVHFKSPDPSEPSEIYWSVEIIITKVLNEKPSKGIDALTFMMGPGLELARRVTGQSRSSSPELRVNLPAEPKEALDHADEYCSPEKWIERYVPKEKSKSQLKEEKIAYLEDELQRLKQYAKEDIREVTNHVNRMTNVLGHTYALLLEVLERKNDTYWIQPPGQTRQQYSLMWERQVKTKAGKKATDAKTKAVKTEKGEEHKSKATTETKKAMKAPGEKKKSRR